MFGRSSSAGCWLAAAVMFACTVSAAIAQQPSTSGVTYVPGTFNRPYYGGGGGYGGRGYGGWGYGGWNGIGSTPAGSFLGGLGMAIRAQGQYNLDTSAAAINLEEAAKRNIENDKLWTQTYFEKRKINQAYQESQRRPPSSPETWVRLAQDAAPARLSPGELDPVTGRIDWPSGLSGPEFKEDRDTLDALFANRALVQGAIGDQGHVQIRDAINRTMAKLRSRISNFPTNLYISSRRFLTSLLHEASLPTTGYTTAASR